MPMSDHRFGDMIMEPFVFSTNNAMPLIPECDVGSLLPHLGLPCSIGLNGQDLFFQVDKYLNGDCQLSLYLFIKFSSSSTKRAKSCI